MSKRQSRLVWLKEINDIVRGAAGGFLFGIPLLYTFEVWQAGSYLKPPLMLAILAATYLVVFFFNRVEGFRRKKRTNLSDVFLESIEALAIAIVCATFIMILLQRITLNTSLEEALGKIIFESVPFALGVALSRLILSEDDSNNSSDNSRTHEDFMVKKLQKVKGINETLADLGGTLTGAIIIAFSIAPTDEVTELGVASSPPWLIAIILASLFISYLIVFAAGFANQKKRKQQQGLFQTPESETILSYLISLMASLLMLLFFQKLSLGDPWFLWIRYTILLGLPASIGGAAGRLAV
ncbi:TIGR02587 family membrane protein [Capilliphycus salinus ALCB114379]|uniref:TIGR02587 family membrane protein n=1 Tax=Capilliphycus salinus TaxID=2768948 RepID=UPI0039A523AB